MIQYDTVNPDSAVISISGHTFHTVVTDFIRIQIAAVAFSASDALPVVEYALFIFIHHD